MRRPNTSPTHAATAILTATLAAHTATPSASAANVDFPRFPSISPDGTEIAFSWRGDIFTASLDPAATTLSATRLTNHPLDELYTAYTPDGSAILFTSEQFGADNIFRIDRDGTDPTQITRSDRSFVLSDHHPTENAALGHARREGDVYRAPRPYAASTDTGRITRLHDAFGNLPAASPSGDRIAFERGTSSWNRRHYRGPDNRDLYLHHAPTATFHRLTTWNGNDGLPRFRDENTLLFLSDRELDTVNIYQAKLNTDNTLDQDSLRRVTSFEGKDVQWFDVDARGRTAVLHVWDTLYTIDLNNNRPPRPLTIAAPSDLRDNIEITDVNGKADDAALSPDGKTMAYIANGDLFIRNIENEEAPTRRVTGPDNTAHARERNPAWSPDGLRLYFQSDHDGTESIYAATVKTTRDELKRAVLEVVNPEAAAELNEPTDTPATNADATDPDATTSHAHPAAGRWEGTAELAGVPDMPAQVPFTLTVTADENANLTASINAMGSSLPVSSISFDEPTLTISLPWPDGSTVTLTGDLTDDTLAGAWTTPNATGEWSATRTQTFPTPQPESPDDSSDPGNADDSDEPAENRPPHLDPDRWHDAVRFTVEPAVQTEHHDMEPRPLPDGRRISFRRGLGDVIVRDLVTDDEHTIIRSWDTGVDWRFTADARYTVYAADDMDFNSDIFITPTAPDESFPDGPINLSMHPDNDVSPRISADGKVLAFLSERADEQYDVYAVYLDADLDDLPTPDLDAYFERAANNAKEIKPIDPVDLAALRQRLEEATDADSTDQTPEDDEDRQTAETLEPEDLASAFLRLRRITRHEGWETELHITPAGDRFIYAGSPNGTRALYSVDRDGEDRKKIGPNANTTGFSNTANKLVFVRAGAGGTADPTGNAKTFPIRHTIRIDLAKQASQKFQEAARTLGRRFYHPNMKGLDWDALADRYHQLARQTRTADEFAHTASRFLGELNASHLGVYPPSPSSDIAQPAGRLGIDHTLLPQQDGTAHYRVDRVIFDAPASDTDMALRPDDIITAVNLQPITHSLEDALRGRVGEETIITVQRNLANAGDPADDQTDEQPVNAETVTLDLLITPVSYRQESTLRYTDWTLQRRERVDELSDGRLGYLHIRSMGGGSLEDFERDLFAAAYDKDGLIIDVRNNPGGWITDRLLASIMARQHAYTIPRGADRSNTSSYPQDRLYIQRYTKPINLLINEKSFSNAEIFAHAFNALERGTTVGVQTYGGVISTGAFRLVDGTRVRLPFRGWYLDDGTDMENNGAKPDITIPQTPEHETADRDEQLEVAVRELMNRLQTSSDTASR